MISMPDSTSRNNHFLLYPAVDLQGGKAVRLSQGKASDSKVYFDDPVEPARQFRQAGAKVLHVVDLDGAFRGNPQHMEILGSFADLGLFVEYGGGLRNTGQVAVALGSGPSRVVVGTRALEDEEFLKAILRDHGDRIAVGIDARNGKVATHGWVETSDVDAYDFADRAVGLGAKVLIYTDIATDGMLTGPNIEAQEAMASRLPGDVTLIASGGVSSLEDVGNLFAVHARCPQLKGVIIGRALYEGKLNLAEAIERYQRG